MKLCIIIHCNDQIGIISNTTNFIQQKGGNIVYLDQHVDRNINVFFMRTELILRDEVSKERFENEFKTQVADRYQMTYEIYNSDRRPRMAVFVSKFNHCLYDILSRYQAGEWNVEIPFIISNHADLKAVAEQFNIPFHHIPVSKETKDEAEAEQLALLKEANVDFIVLARYMQIVSPHLISEFEDKIINIHHSFLPAFAGARPYHAAFDRGVKIIGATSHYVTEDLDAGPIIEQDTTLVSHIHSVQDFISKGRDLEKIVLSKAVSLHLNRKTIVYNNKTIIFS
jgi:formyltetrahydrofolate deformylase